MDSPPPDDPTPRPGPTDPHEEETVARPRQQPVPERIGPYRLLEQIGSGGMGVVFQAEQTEPVRRRVALKLIKLGMDTEQVVARFEAERQALALMDHSGIARVFDAGATPDGRPFFVMEFVRGVPITHYCDKHRLSMPRRLELFIRVCEALQHAHQKGIIHRDLKPSNILVETEGVEPVPKIIDFGVAKATNQRLTERTVFTEQGQMIGTPEYMSPEQAEMTMLDVDTRTDIYSMGVVLYELLVGALPFEPRSLRQAGFAGIQQILREQEPPRPSTRFSTLGGESDETARARTTDRGSLVRTLKGDLDWITMKAMDKDKTRRYPSASELAADVRRYLDHDPVLASPPSTAYRLRKLMRRNRAAVAGAAAVVAALVLGIGATGWQSIRAVRAEHEARTQAEIAEKVNDFLTGMLSQADPGSNPTGRDMTVVEAVEAAGRQLDTGDRDPRVAFAVRNTLASTLMSLGRFAESRNHFETSLERLPADLDGTAGSVLMIKLQLSTIAENQGRLDESERLAREVLEASLDDPDLLLHHLAAHIRLSVVLSVQGQLEAAHGLLEQALELARTRDDEKAREWQAIALDYLAQDDVQNMDLEAAEERIREALRIRRVIHGDIHPAVADSLSELATTLSEAGRFDEGRPLFEEAIAMERRIHGDDHWKVGTVLNEFARFLMRYDAAAAEPYARESVEILRSCEVTDAVLATPLANLGSILQTQGRLEEAEPYYLEALASERRSLPPDSPRITISQNGLGALYRRMGRYREAEAAFREVLDRFRAQYGPGHVMVASGMHNLGKTLSDQGKVDEAHALLQEALEVAEGRFPKGHVNVAIFKSTYGECLGRMSRFEAAEAVLLEAYPPIRDQFGGDHWRSQQVAGYLADLYRRWGRAAERDTWQQRAGS